MVPMDARMGAMIAPMAGFPPKMPTETWRTTAWSTLAKTEWASGNGKAETADDTMEKRGYAGG